jgi:hypothetical protein
MKKIKKKKKKVKKRKKTISKILKVSSFSPVVVQLSFTVMNYD